MYDTYITVKKLAMLNAAIANSMLSRLNRIVKMYMLKGSLSMSCHFGNDQEDNSVTNVAKKMFHLNVSLGSQTSPVVDRRVCISVMTLNVE